MLRTGYNACMKKVYLIRHGHTDTSGNFDSRNNISLNSKGKASCIRLAQWLKERKIEKLYSSPVTRAIETADILHAYLDLPYEIGAGLQEIDFGEWQEKSYKEVCEQYPDYLKEIAAKRESFAYPNGESIHQFNQRVWMTLKELSNTDNQNIVLITHKGVIESIVGKILSISSIFLPLTIYPASCSILLLNNAQWSLESLNIRFDYENV